VLPPPAPTAATSSGLSTWRAPPSPHSWTHASCRKPYPCSRPADSCPPCVLTGSSPSRAIRLPPSMNGPPDGPVAWHRVYAVIINAAAATA